MKFLINSKNNKSQLRFQCNFYTPNKCTRNRVAPNKRLTLQKVRTDLCTDRVTESHVNSPTINIYHKSDQCQLNRR